MLGLVVDFFYRSERQYSNFLEKYECLNLGTHKLRLNSYFESILVLHWIKIMEQRNWIFVSFNLNYYLLGPKVTIHWAHRKERIIYYRLPKSEGRK